MVSTVQCTDVWNKICYSVRYPAPVTYLGHSILLPLSDDITHLFNFGQYHRYQNFFLLPYICIGICPKSPIRVWP